MSQLNCTIYKTPEESFYFRVRDEHDNILLTSRLFNNHITCARSLYLLQAGTHVHYQSCMDQGIFKVYDSQGVCLARSAVYENYIALKSAMRVFGDGIRSAAVNDLSLGVRFIVAAE